MGDGRRLEPTPAPDVVGLAATLQATARDLRTAGDLLDDWGRSYATPAGRPFAEYAAGDLYAAAALIAQAGNAVVAMIARGDQ